MQIKDSTFLVTGGSLGIGKATAKLLVEKGGKVAITGRNKSRLEKAAIEIGAFPINADAGKPEDIKKTYDEFLKEFDRELNQEYAVAQGDTIAESRASYYQPQELDKL